MARHSGRLAMAMVLAVVLSTVPRIRVSAQAPGSQPTSQPTIKALQDALQELQAHPPTLLPMWWGGGLKIAGRGTGIEYSELPVCRPKDYASRLATVFDHPSVKLLVAGGDPAAELVERALAKAKPDPKMDSAEAYLFILGRIGRAQSVPAIIECLRARLEQKAAQPGMTDPVPSAAIWALWELSGQKEERPTAAAWQEWWQAVKGDFVPARLRGQRKVDPARVKELAQALIDGSDGFAGDKLIALGPNCVDQLVEMAGVAAKTDADDDAHAILRVIDELGGIEKLPNDVRKRYYSRRLSEVNPNTTPGRETLLRAIRVESYSDFCQVIMEAERRVPDRWWGWAKSEWDPFRAKLAGDPNQFADATDVLAGGITHEDLNVRKIAVGLIGSAAVATGRAPQRLFKVLQEQWKAETNEWVRTEIICALGRVDTPALRQAVREGLWSDREDILGDCAYMAGDGRDMIPNNRKVIGQRLAELTSHASNRVRFQSVRALRCRAPDLLTEHLERLSKDDRADIRCECAIAIGSLPNPEHARLLVALAQDEQEQVRMWGVTALSKKTYLKTVSVADLAPLMKYPDSALSVMRMIAERGGPEAAAVLLAELREGSPIAHDILSVLGTMARRTFSSSNDAIAWWWEFTLPEPPVEPAKLDARQTEALWPRLGEDVSLQSYQDVRALAGGGDAAAEFLGRKLRPVAADAATLDKLIADLGAGSFAVRAAAQAELARAGRSAEAALKQALAAKPSPEARARLEKLLEACGLAYPAMPESRQAANAVRALELIGTRPARGVLDSLAQGDAQGLLTLHARAALRRLATAATQPGATQPAAAVPAEGTTQPATRPAASSPATRPATQPAPDAPAKLPPVARAMDPDARQQFLAVEGIARLPAAEQAKELPRLYRELAVRYMSDNIEGILSSNPTNILDRRPENGFRGGTAAWAQQLSQAASTFTAEEVADGIETGLWLNVAARARALQVLNLHPEATADLIEADLKSRQKVPVQRAAITISALKSRAFTSRLLALFLADDENSETAFLALLSLNDPAIVAPLLDRVRTEPKFLSRCAGLFQGPLWRKPAEPLLLKLLDSPDADIRLHAAYAVSECRDSKLAAPAVRLAGEKDVSLRVAAAQLASNLPEDAFASVRKDLLRLLSDPDEVVRFDALRGFARQKDIAAGPVILEMLCRPWLDEQQKVTVMQAANALTGGKTYGYDMHNWGPLAPGNQRAIDQFGAWLKARERAATQPATQPTTAPSPSAGPERTVHPQTRPASQPATQPAPPVGANRAPGVELTLAFDRTVYLPTEDIWATTKIASDGDEPISLWHTTLSGNTFGLFLEVRDPSGAACKYIGGWGDGPPFAHVTSKGRPYSYCYQLRWWYEFAQPGEYQIVAKYVDAQRRQSFASPPYKVQLVNAAAEKVISSRIVRPPGGEVGQLYELVRMSLRERPYYFLRQWTLNPTIPQPLVSFCRRIEVEGLDDGRIADDPAYVKGCQGWKIALPGDNTLFVNVFLNDTGRMSWVKAPRKPEDLTLKQEGPKYSALFLEDRDGKRYVPATQPAATGPAEKTTQPGGAETTGTRPVPAAGRPDTPGVRHESE